MKRIIATILLSFVIASMLPDVLEADAEVPLPPTKGGYMVMANLYAKQYDVSARKMKETIKCESSWNPDAENETSRELSYGLSQINTKAHTNITEEQAKDPEFAIKFMAENFSKNKENMWTCYRNK